MLSSVQHARTTSAQENLLEDANPELLEGSGMIRVSVANTRMIELQEPMRNLLHYPYGCVEQTTSSTLPWIVLNDFQKALPDLKKSPEEIEDAVQYGINRIFTMQTDSGGLSY